MKPVHFVAANSTLLAGKIPDCEDLPVYKDSKQIISKWRMSFKERLSALLFGTVFVSVLAPKTSPPIALWVERNTFPGEKGWKIWRFCRKSYPASILFRKLPPDEGEDPDYGL